MIALSNHQVSIGFAQLAEKPLVLGFLFLVETTLKPTNEITNIIEQVNTN